MPERISKNSGCAQLTHRHLLGVLAITFLDGGIAMFNSIYSEKLTQYYNLRCSVLSESAKKHELCYLRRFDHFLNENISGSGQLTEGLMSKWISTLSGKSGSVENMVIVINVS